MRLAMRLLVLAGVLIVLLLLTLLAVIIGPLSHPLGLLGLFAAVVIILLVARRLRRRVRRNTILELDLDASIVEQVPADPLGRARASRALLLRDVVDGLDRAASDERVTALIARVGNGTLGLAQTQELRDAVARFRAAGKKAIAFAETFGEGANATIPYYLAAAFDEVHLQPNGEVNVVGVVARAPFLKGLLDLADAVPDFDHRKEFKSAMYLFTEEGFNEPHREVQEHMLDAQLTQIVTDLAADRRLDAERVRGLIDEAPLEPEEALGGGLVDGLSYRDEVYGAVKGEKGHLLYLHRYLKRAGRPHKRGDLIALIYGTGIIRRGEPSFDLLTQSSTMPSDQVAKAFRRAARSKKVKAIVFRVDSRGGSAVASEVVRRAMQQAQEAGKPVVISMGNVAASGGYWVSATANHIVAQPGTITGSIGVVAGKVVTRGAWGRIGISWDELHRGRNATFMTPDHPFSDSERQRLQRYLDGVYDGFKERVAEGRPLDLDQVEDVAKGRVWSGAEAHQLGLVDELGGVDRAVELAKEAAGIDADKPVRVGVFPKPRTFPLPEPREHSEAVLRTALDVLETATRATRGTTRVVELG